MLALVDLSRFCKLDSSCSAVHELPVAVQFFDFGSAGWASAALDFNFGDLDDFSPILVADAPSTPSHDNESTFARFVGAFVVVDFAFVRFVVVLFFGGKSISLSSSEEIVSFTVIFGNFLLVLVGVAALVAIFSLETLQTIEQIRCPARQIMLQFALTLFFSMAMARNFHHRF